MITEVEVRAALAEVIHPSFGISILALDMVRAIRILEATLEVDLVLNCPGCPSGELVLSMMRKKIEAFQAGVVRLNLLSQVWTPPWA